MDIQIVLSVFAKMGQLRPRDQWTRQQLETYQVDALRSLRDYAYTHSPFYQRFHHGLTNAPLYELPVLTKALLIEHFDDLVTNTASMGRGSIPSRTPLATTKNCSFSSLAISSACMQR
jgi:phenylacetate-coenzyme A ligase PaaK-like adenylate-forming protein